MAEQVESGTCGIRWCVPPGVELAEDGARRALWRDRDGVLHVVSRSPWPFALGAAGGELDPTLRADLEASSRAAFVATWQEAADAGRSTVGRPRTDDAAWSPLVEATPVALAGGDAVAVVRRVTYTPGDELIAGELIVPVADGHVVVAILARSTFTGTRESVTMLTGGHLEADVIPAQAVFDRRELDAQFPQHPLSIVRRALDALTAAGAIEVTRPAPRSPREVILTEAGCAITPPPRFVRLPRGLLPLSPTLCMMARLGVDGWRRMFEVWRLPAEDTAGDATELAKLADRIIAAWEHEGATDIRASTRTLPELDGRPQVEQQVRYRSAEGAELSCFRWLLDGDGTIFRIGASGDGDVAPDTLRAELAAAVPTWRRLDAPGPARPPPPRRPWWKVW